MRYARILPLALVLWATGCTEPADPNSDRRPLPTAKADQLGSCTADTCGGPADDGPCWCDDKCEFYGDCCENKAATCDEEPPAICGGFAGFVCDEGEFCAFPSNATCGWADATGVCQPRPDACIELFAPVCGCDGKTYSNSCHANSAGTSVLKDGPCEDQPKQCGGFAGLLCPEGLVCVDDPNDSCDPANGGADCGGICVEPDEPACCEPDEQPGANGNPFCIEGATCCGNGEWQCNMGNGGSTCETAGEVCEQECQPVLCTLFCSNGFETDENGCEVCQCKPETDSCEGSCGGPSSSGACWCDDLCSSYGDCCSDVDAVCS